MIGHFEEELHPGDTSGRITPEPASNSPYSAATHMSLKPYAQGLAVALIHGKK